MIEKYVVSLDLAKKLKEAGWKKETVYWWVKTQHGIRLEAIRYIELYPNQSYGIIWLDDAGKEEFMPLAPAPLTEEILEKLPKKIVDDKTYRLRIEIHDDHYTVGYCYDYLFSYQQGKNAVVESVLRWLELITDSDISNALARLWLWLKENGYLEERNEAGKNL